MALYYDIDDIIMEDQLISANFQVDVNRVGCLTLVQKQIGTRKEIQADAANVDLRSRCRYFYEMGCKVATMIRDRNIGPFLLYAFKNRFSEVLRKAHGTAFVATPKFSTLLTKEETELYEAARSSMTAFKKWRVGGPRFERASILKKKRKSTD